MRYKILSAATETTDTFKASGCVAVPSGYLLQLIQLLSDRLVLRLQLIKPLLELLLLLQHRQPILGRLDLLLGCLMELPVETLHLGSEPVGPGLCHQYRFGIFLLLRGHLWRAVTGPSPGSDGLRSGSGENQPDRKSLPCCFESHC